MKLFNIGEDLMALEALLEESGGEIRPEHEQAVDAWQAEVREHQADKLDNMAGLIKSLEGEAAVATATADQFKKKAETRQRSADWLKSIVKNYLAGTNQKKVATTSGFTFNVVNNGGNPPLVLDDAVEIPSEFTKTIPAQVVPDKPKIVEALKSGQSLAFAKFGERGTYLKLS